MQFKSFIKKLACVAMICGAVSVMNSCQDKPAGGDGPVVGTGSISGTVLDTEGAPVDGVVVSLLNNEGITATTNSSGAYTLSNVPLTKQVVVFTKAGYASYAVVLPLKNFSSGSAVIDATIQFAQARVKGKILDGANGNAPLAGATVTLGTSTLKTGADGSYEFTDLVISPYTLVASKGDGTKSYSYNIQKADFVDGLVQVMDIVVGGTELIPGLTAFDLKTNGIKIYANEYWGGKSIDRDWSCVFMSAAMQSSQELKTPNTNMEYQNEGWCCRVRNNYSTGNADFDNFDSFIYGTKLIKEENKILTVNARTHQGSPSTPAFLGVQVIDLSQASPVAVKVGQTYRKENTGYNDYTFDLSEYIGKEITIVIGVYFGGNWWVQTPIRRICFANTASSGTNVIPGTAITGFRHLTLETVKSMTLETRKSFTGLPNAGSGVTNGKKGYQGWQGTSHICANWGFLWVSKDTEPLNAEGFVIKTTNGKAADYSLPESYFYGKFAIASGCNTMVFTTRNYSDDPTCFKVCAITEDGVVTAVAPKSNTAKSASAVSGGEGCWQFVHNDAEMATFTYDFSQFNGKNVVITLGVYKGAVSSGEQKLVINSIDFK